MEIGGAGRRDENLEHSAVKLLGEYDMMKRYCANPGRCRG